MMCKNCGRAVRYTGGKSQGFAADYVHDNGLVKCLREESGNWGLGEREVAEVRDADLPPA